MFDVPNLDGLSVDPYDLDIAAEVLSTLGLYAELKARAMRLRLAGDVSAAMLHERRCEGLYRKLPEWARW